MPGLESVLDAYGFEVIHPEKLSLPDQAKIFSQAAIICGSHGAAHTNMIFAHESALIIEIFGGVIGFRTYYASLAIALGMTYKVLMSRSEDPSCNPKEIFLSELDLRNFFKENKIRENE